MISVKVEKSSEGSRILNAIKSLKNSGVKVGWVEASYHPESNEPIAAIAAQNEYGNPKKNIPARPFIRPTIQEKEKEWRKTAQNGAKKVLKNEITSDRVFDLLGSKAEGDIKKTIKKLYYPALAEKTVLNRIERNKRLSLIKGRLTEKHIGNITKPLVDTGLMYDTLTHELTRE